MSCRGHSDAYDRPSFWREKERKARKPHTCLECQGTIPPGQKYLSFAARSRFDGFYAWNVCMRCKKDWDAFMNLLWRYGEKAHIEYGSLGTCVVGAFAEGLIPRNRVLAKRWVRPGLLEAKRAAL